MNSPATIHTPSAIASSPTSSPVHPAVRALAMIVAGGSATALCYAAINSIGLVYPTPSELLNLGASPTVEERATAAAAKLAADSGNAMVWLGMTGAILGGILALTIGWLRGDGKRVVLGAVGGIVLAGGMGCLAGSLAVAYHSSINAKMIGSTSGAETQFMMMHGITWGLIGLGIGLASGLGSQAREWKSVCTSIVVAGVAGCLAGAAFPLVVAIAAPLADSSLPIPAPGTGRVMWIGVAALFTGVGLSRTE